MCAKIAETGNKACLIWKSNISKLTYPGFLYEKKPRYFAFAGKIKLVVVFTKAAPALEYDFFFFFFEVGLLFTVLVIFW